MLTGTVVALRARAESDVAILHAGLQDDVATKSRADSRPWRPIPLGAASPFAIRDQPDETVAIFSVVELASNQLAGEALLWGLDNHNRLGHLGISLLPSFRGRGLAADVIGQLCRYGFRIRGLHRLQLETLADNDAMIRTALACGFVREATLRRNAWVDGEFLDEAIFGLLAADWTTG
ncbi:MAG: GNAT family N-acetyltransferase [Actinomycetota bacterium]|nr:GNAT family N-acetyltransferase [Actinomycetota bacterium]MDQ2959047.1 GNAT family N-acetyltransferase [Actinomycetota bacterium]